MAECFQCAGPASERYLLRWDARALEQSLCEECAVALERTEWIEVGEDPRDADPEDSGEPGSSAAHD